MNPVSTIATTPREFLAALRTFALAHGGPCYRNWSPETLEDYFAWHLLRGTLSWCRNGTAVCGLAVAWPETSARLDAADAASRPVFDWTLPAAADVLFVGDVVTTHAHAWPALGRVLVQRHPHWLALPWRTYRRGRLVTLPGRFKAMITMNPPQPKMTGGN